jgi:peptidoglycan/xylan/chitin deacetylase (PgdA/CDA1 family)
MKTKAPKVSPDQPAAKLEWLPILMYHGVGGDSGPNPYHLFIPKEGFEAQMRFLKNHGYRAISFEDLALRETLSDRRRDKKAKEVIITFDDGYRDIFLHAFPILKKYQLTATVFPVSSCLGGSNVWDRGKTTVREVQLLLLSELKEMGQYGISFGSHSVTHRRLTGLDAHEAKVEIRTSRVALEQALGMEVRSFSFPYGSSNPTLRDMVRQAGYVAACGIEQREHQLFNLSRIDAPRCRGSGLLWRWKVLGLYFKMRQLHSRFRN